MSIVVKFENISKQYRLGLVSTRTLSHDLNRWFTMNIRRKEDPYLKIGETNDRSHKGNSEYVWALKDINFEVEQGDVVGIIGKNGAGKSTLLKILSKVTSPTTGSICAKGRIASLLEVGTGFHPELTGRDNIYMNGAIMGMSKPEIAKKLDEIIDFAGVERYIDTPVKRYSSGMTVRLGFAVAAHLEPEILVVDEVLAVGDAEFQKKAIGKMQDVSRGEGRTVLFVSHNMAAIQTLCNKGVLLENGKSILNGNVNDVVVYYLDKTIIKEKKMLKDLFVIKTKDLIISDVLVDNSPYNHLSLNQQKSFQIIIKGELLTSKKLSLEMRLYDEKETPLALYSPYHANSPMIEKGKFELNHVVHLPEGMAKGKYVASLNLVNSMTEGYADCNKSLIINSEGFSTETGFVLDYNRGAGWLHLI